MLVTYIECRIRSDSYHMFLSEIFGGTYSLKFCNTAGLLTVSNSDSETHFRHTLTKNATHTYYVLRGLTSWNTSFQAGSPALFSFDGLKAKNHEQGNIPVRSKWCEEVQWSPTSIFAHKIRNRFHVELRGYSVLSLLKATPTVISMGNSSNVNYGHETCRPPAFSTYRCH